MEKRILIPTKEVVNFAPKETHTKDTANLCGTKHQIQIGVTEHKNNQITPFDDYIVVYFRPQDTSGGGKVEEYLVNAVTTVIDYGWRGITEGLPIMVSDPIEYETTVATGLDIVVQNLDDCVDVEGTVWECKGEYAEAVGFSTVYIITTPVRVVSHLGSGIYGGVKSLFAENEQKPNFDAENRISDKTSPFYAPRGLQENFTQVFNAYEPDAPRNEATECGGGAWNAWKEWTGGCYHSLGGGRHRIRIKITCEYDGQTLVKYDSELAGCNATYDKEDGIGCEIGEAYDRFLINSPGKWTVDVRSQATSTCENMDYVQTAQFDVPTPEEWEPSPIQTFTNDLTAQLQEAGLPVSITPLKFVAAASLLGGLLMVKLFKKKRAKAE